MIFKLVTSAVARGKARFICAAMGVAAAVGAVTFTYSLAETNAAQAPKLAERAACPWKSWKVEGDFERGRMRSARAREQPLPVGTKRARPPAGDLTLELAAVTIDYRPGGRVLQGPPMRAVIAPAPSSGSPYDSAPLVAGRWTDEAAAEPEVVCAENVLRRFGRGKGAALGDMITFVGRNGTFSARLVGYLSATKLPRGFPDVFANRQAFSRLAGERRGSIVLWKDAVEAPGVLNAGSESVVAFFKGDEQRRMDYARPLMLIAAILTALALLVNSLLISVESSRKSFMILRTAGLTRSGVVLIVAVEALMASAAGLIAGITLAAVALWLFVAADPAAFPVGPAFDLRAVAATAALTFATAVLSVLIALRPALSVRALDVSSRSPRRRRAGMAVAFGCGFAAFAAVEVWGASLMRGFVPSPEWPDAAVSILPCGVSSFEVEKLRTLEGVRRISELYPLQLELPALPGESESDRRHANALFLAAEWLPEFRFTQGSWCESERAVREQGACVISLMMARARGLGKGDRLRVVLGGRRGPKSEVSLPIAGVVDVNWHMVTSRALVRGLNGASPMTDGPVFVSLDTIESLDARPAPSVRMTHLWVEYEKSFLERHGVFPAGRRIERAIAAALGGPEGSTVRLHARDEIADGTLAHGSDIIGQAARVPFVFLAILAIGFIAMLVAEADAQKRNYAILRAVGATRLQLVLRLVRKAAATAVVGIGAGFPAGAAAGWYFAAGTASRWPGMPNYFVVPWRLVAEGAAGAVLFALVVAVPTAIFLIERAHGKKSSRR